MKHRDLWLTLAALVVVALVISFWPSKAHASNAVPTFAFTHQAARVGGGFDYTGVSPSDPGIPAPCSFFYPQTPHGPGNLTLFCPDDGTAPTTVAPEPTTTIAPTTTTVGSTCVQWSPPKPRRHCLKYAA